eukprot:SAG31_NODE_22537_length_523_cov_1.089623_1_plen_137_part_10
MHYQEDVQQVCQHGWLLWSDGTQRAKDGYGGFLSVWIEVTRTQLEIFTTDSRVESLEKGDLVELQVDDGLQETGLILGLESGVYTVATPSGLHHVVRHIDPKTSTFVWYLQSNDGSSLTRVFRKNTQKNTCFWEKTP